MKYQQTFITITCLFHGLILAFSDVEVHSLTVEANEAQTADLVCKHKYEITIGNLTSSAQYVLFQVHSQWADLIISENNHTSYGHYRKGNDVGIIQILSDGQADASCFVWCADTKRNKVKVLLFAQVATSEAPIPGGCNMEFPLENDPNILIDSASITHIRKVEFQYANTAAEKWGPAVSCEGRGQDFRKKLSYAVYEYMLEDLSVREGPYFKYLSNILTDGGRSDEILGRKVKNIAFNGTTEQNFRTYKRQGVIYTVRVTDASKHGHPHALYVPVHTYGCADREDCVRYSTASIFSLVALAVVALLGIFIAFFGHRFFKTEMFVFGHVALMLALLLVLVRFSSFQFSICVITASSLGIFGGVGWLALWYFKGNPLVAIIMPSLVMGFLFSTIVFCYTPFGDLQVFANPFSYGAAFACFILFLPVAFLYFTKLLNILCCAFVGTFLLMWVISLNLGGNFRHIMQDMLYSLTSKAYLLADDFIPFTDNDIILCVIWVALFTTAMLFQLSREKGRPPFPPCPYQLRKRNMPGRELHNPPVVHAQIENAHGFGNETDPLLAPRGASVSPTYGSGRGSTRGPSQSPARPGSGRGSSLSTEDHSAIIDPAL